jgi:hypothetical protein
MTHEEALRRIEELEAENRKLRERLARAKNPEPVQKPTLERVHRLARNACMDVTRWKHGGFVLHFGRTSRWFKTLKELWEIFTSDSWCLDEIFAKKVLPRIPRRPRKKVPTQQQPGIVQSPKPHPLWYYPEKNPQLTRGDPIPFS